MKIIKFMANEAEEEKKKCKGLFWRGRTCAYTDSTGNITVRKELRLLKRMSCTGCDECGWFIDYLREDVALMDDSDKYLDHIENGKVYTYKVNCSKGYYDLYEEIDSIEFIEVKS